MSKLETRLLPGFLGSVLLLAIVLVGCGVASSGTPGAAPSTQSSPTSGRPTPTSSASSTPGHSPASASQLACVVETVVQPIDTVRETLHCTVAHAASSETAFVLHYQAMNKAGQPQTIAPVCQGALSGGNGSCTITYTLVVPLALSMGTVSGVTAPDHYPLGPVVPTQKRGPPTGPPAPF